MKSRTLTCITAITFFAALAVPVRLGAQQHSRYRVIDLGTFGGPNSDFNFLGAGPFFDSGKVLNKRGILAGWSDTATPDPYPAFCFNFDCFVSHAFRWQKGTLTDLGTLAAGWSSAATWINDTGQIVGLSQNGVIDPLIGFPEVHAVLWQNGQIIDLGTMGGNQSAALGINNHRQIAGLALNAVPDPFSIYDLLLYGSPNGTQTRAVLWDKDGGIEDLGTLGGPDAYALLVNEHGQVTGWSYTNSTPNPTTGLPTFHPFLWEKGKGMQDLGTLGGTVAQAVNGLNERGQVVGSSTLAGDVIWHAFLWDGKKLLDLGTLGGPSSEADWVNDAGEVVGIASYTVSCPNGLGGAHAFLWRNGVMTDLGTTGGLSNSEADFINSKGQIVGYSFPCDDSSANAFLWENGSIVDLNTLISPHSAFHLTLAAYIDDQGRIAAFGLLPNGDQHDVLLVPCGDGDKGCEDSAASAATPSGPAPVSARASTAPPANPALRGRGMLDRFRARQFPGRRTPSPASGPTR